MDKLFIENLESDYDFKQILLGDSYDTLNPVKNILLAKNNNNYKDITTDYSLDKRTSEKRGHIENYKLIEEVFQKLSLGNTDYKDIMNSFWTTYKCYLQIAYPIVFCPDGKEKDIFPLTISEETNAPSIAYPPHVSGKNKNISDKYLKYYTEELAYLEFIINKNDTWLDFLMNNFDKFEKVHKYHHLERFANLTHTIGNIAVVPIGFNAGRAGYDYWDWGLEYLKEFLEPIDAWSKYLEIHDYIPYVDVKKNNEIRPFWTNHLNTSKHNLYLLPKTEENIKDYLKFVNKCIEYRGIEIIKKINPKNENKQ